jgi:biopolymer transport protein ExbD
MPLRTAKDDPPVMNMIPMIDIMFNLIIFLMVGTEFATSERNIALQLPEVVDKGALTAAPEPMVVNVFGDGSITLGDEKVSLGGLTGRLTEARAQYSDLGVLVRGDGRVQYAAVAEVLNACKQAGVRELAIAVRLAAPPD